MTALERRYRRLLRAYPASYRAARGDEMLTTLVENAQPGGAWPSWRETRALVLGGLQVRTLQHRRQSTAANLRLSVMLGLAVSIALLGSGNIRSPGFQLNLSNPIMLRGGPLPSATWAGVHLSALWPIAAAFALTACAPLAIWIGRRSVAVSLLLAAAVVVPFAEDAVGYGALSSGQALPVGLAPSVLLVALAAVTAVGTARPPRAWLWWYALPSAWIVAERVAEILPVADGRALSGLPLFPVFVLSAVLWVIVDARPALALAVLLAILGVTSAAGNLDPQLSVLHIDLRVAAAYVGTGLVLAAPSLLRVRRQAVL
jgi:hypothetical protein